MRSTLFILVGYPGSGKTTASRLIAELTGAEHIWTDHERHKLFAHPTHSEQESRELYNRLNTQTDQLLSQGKSVIFDTSFNYRRDRDYMRAIAAKYDADIKVIRVLAPRELAKSRALHPDHASSNHYAWTMAPDDFERIAGHLEEPADHEQAIVMDGTMMTKEYVGEALGLQP